MTNALVALGLVSFITGLALILFNKVQRSGKDAQENEQLKEAQSKALRANGAVIRMREHIDKLRERYGRE